MFTEGSIGIQIIERRSRAKGSPHPHTLSSRSIYVALSFSFFVSFSLFIFLSLSVYVTVIKALPWAPTYILTLHIGFNQMESWKENTIILYK